MQKKQILLLIAIFILGLLLRIYQINWDSNFHLQPDERFLTMVGTAIKIPNSLRNYLSPQTSTLNPNNNNFGFYVYGIFPLTVTKLLAVNLHLNTYDGFNVLGRFLSALSDSLVIIFIYLIASLLQKDSPNFRYLPSLAAFFYAIFVLPIQLSHFFAVDTFLNFFVIVSFYSTLRFANKHNLAWLVMSALFFGLAIASKITAVYIAPLLLLFMILERYQKQKSISFKELHTLKVIPILGILLIFGSITYITVRIADPYLFESANLFNPTISKVFIQDIKTLDALDMPTTTFPPSIQWIHKTPVIYALVNLLVFGISIPTTFFLFSGLLFLWREQKNYKQLILIIAWMLIIFLYQSTQFVKTMRYFILLYPFLALLCSLGFIGILRKTPKIVSVLAILLLFIWPLSFMSIYTKPNTRVTASEWIYKNIPAGSLLLLEHWDDGLPLPMQNTYGKTFASQQLPVFDPDTTEKWNKMNILLQQGNYLILASGRAYNNIPTVPERYPKTTQYYHDLFAGKLPYKQIKEFTSYPSLAYLGIPITFPDDWAEEAFVVYDHPKVIIFQQE